MKVYKVQRPIGQGPRGVPLLIYSSDNDEPPYQMYNVPDEIWITFGDEIKMYIEAEIVVEGENVTLMFERVVPENDPRCNF